MGEIRDIKIKTDEAGQLIPGCWITGNGYTISQVDRPGHQFAVARPGTTLPFGYSPKLGEIFGLIEADIEASRVTA